MTDCYPTWDIKFLCERMVEIIDALHTIHVSIDNKQHLFQSKDIKNINCIIKY
jgi:hypothetical protein